MKRERPPPPGELRWQARRLLGAPHRLAFFAAALLMGSSALWWALALVARAAGLVLPWAVPPPLAHGLAFSLGFMPLFIVGFLFTAGPRWLRLPAVPARSLLGPVLALAGGWLLALAGFHLAAPLAGLGIACAALGWTAAMLRLGRMLRTSSVPDRRHLRGVAASAGVAALALATAAASLAFADAFADAGRAQALSAAAVQAALWGFLAPTFVIVSHRMLPFFSADAAFSAEAAQGPHAERPQRLLPAVLLALYAGGATAVAQALWWPLPAPAHALAALLEAPAAVGLAWRALGWLRARRPSNRLLWLLHGGFAWLGAALLLDALSHARVALWGESASLGLAPLHALSMGYLGATLIAMSARVVAGHSGRTVAADDRLLWLYGALQAAVLLRVAAALAPALQQPLTLLAAAAWAAACIGWALRYGGWLGRARADGRPG